MSDTVPVRAKPRKRAAFQKPEIAQPVGTEAVVLSAEDTKPEADGNVPSDSLTTAPSIEPATAPATMKEATMTMKDTLETVTKTSTKVAKEAMEKSMAAMTEMSAMQKANLEAMMASATATTKGFEALATRSMAYSKESMEKSVAAFKAMTAAKSVQELLEIQSDFMKSSMDSFMGEMNKTVEVVSATAKDSLKPLNERATAFMSLMQTKG